MGLEALRELDSAITELRKIRSTGAVFGMLAVDDEFFLLLRPSPGGMALLLSDAAAALDYDIAADALDLLRVDPPEDDDPDLWPEGSLDILTDLGLPAPELQVIASDEDLFPDQQLQMIAQRCGFADQFTALLDRIQQ
jgi:putative tRNA adenosine deaminase-associated protein